MKNLLLLFSIVNFAFEIAVAQKKQEIIIHDFENRPQTESWWRVNQNVTFSYDRSRQNQLNKQSKTCLYVRWNSIPSDKPFTWFTDLKADTLAADGMESTWNSFQQDTWLSFWCKGGEGDTLILHYLVLSKGHSSKWGSTKMIPVVDKNWTFYKVRFADLHYENWGKVNAKFDLKTDIGRCFEVGLRSGSVRKKGYIEAWFDNIKLSNYEPFN